MPLKVLFSCCQIARIAFLVVLDCYQKSNTKMPHFGCEVLLKNNTKPPKRAAKNQYSGGI
ncbi:hypothetical protein HHE014_00640 [Helicobacter heilmannii]|nr:hypothetical protein HHE014_00640 [Helicobacter heilmannii]